MMSPETTAQENKVKNIKKALKGTMQKRIGCAIIVSVGVALANLVGPTAVMAANTPGSTTVVNTTANPVPVVQQGAVSLATGTSVKVTADAPLRVTTSQPQLVRLRGIASNDLLPLWTVPQGKRLVIDHASWRIETTNSGQPWGGVLTCNLNFTDVHVYNFPLVSPGTAGTFNGNAIHVFIANSETKIVVPAGQQISIQNGGQDAVLFFEADLTGTLVDDDGTFISVDTNQ